MAELIYYCGTMDSGKSTLALQTAHNHQSRGRTGLIFTNKDRAALRHSCDVIRGSFSSIETPKDPEVVSDMN